MPRLVSTSSDFIGSPISSFDPILLPEPIIMSPNPLLLPNYDPYYETNVPYGIDYLLKKKRFLPPVPYYEDASTTVTSFDDISTVISSEDEYGNIKNTIITRPIFAEPYDQSLITSWLPDYIHPMVSTYRDLNSDPTMKKKITKYFRTHVLDKWINKEMSDILNYLTVNNAGEVSFIKNLNDYDPNAIKKDSPSNIQAKIKFLGKYILTFDITFRILSRYVRETGVQWVNLPGQKYYIRKVIEKKMMKLIKNAINEIRK